MKERPRDCIRRTVESRGGVRYVVSSLVCCIMLFALAGNSAAASEKEVGSVKDLRGSGSIMRAKQTMDARKSDPIFRSDIIRTFDKSKMKLLFVDDSLLMIGENSRVTIATHTDSKGKTNVFNLMDGVVNVIVGKSGLEIHTPTTVSAARGTSYVVWVENDGTQKTGVAVSEGRVDVRNTDESVREKIVVPAGKMSFVEEGNAPTPAVVAPPEVIQVLYRRTLEQDEIWGPVILRAKGSAIPPPDASGPQARLMALRAAKVEALRNLLEQSYRVAIVSDSTVQDYVLKSDVVKARVDGFIKGAWVSEERLLADGSYEVEMEIGLGLGFRRMLLEQGGVK